MIDIMARPDNHGPMRMLKPYLALLLPMACAPMPRAAAPGAQAEGPPLVVFLVRHAEKVDDSRDPKLTDAGHARAAALARSLRAARLDHVHSSDYIRTRRTAEPTAEQHGLKVQLYDARDLPALVKRLRQTGGRHLVVGHSNTTPTVVELLTGSAGPPIDDAEYDRLYVVSLSPSGAATTVLLTYGD